MVNQLENIVYFEPIVLDQFNHLDFVTSDLAYQSVDLQILDIISYFTAPYNDLIGPYNVNNTGIDNETGDVYGNNFDYNIEAPEIVPVASPSLKKRKISYLS